MEHYTPSNTVSEKPFRIPTIVWILVGGLIIALAAIFVFGVPAGTVGYYSLFALFMGSHFFMHAGHGGHGGHNRQGLNQDGSTANSSSKDDHAGH